MYRLLVLAPLLVGCVEYDLQTWDSVDVFHQNPVDEVDILLVVDNSCSMEPYQQKLGENFTSFITWFIDADIDYHIGVVTTDVESALAGQLRGPIITAETDDAAGQFDTNVNVGITGSGFEMGLESAAMALTPPLSTGANQGFLREEAGLSIIFVSDEEDGSPWPVNDYINGFFEVKGQRARDVFNASALTVTDLTECNATQAAQSTPGTRYIDVARQTGGVIGNLCSNDFERIVSELSLNSSRMRDTFYLSESPHVPSLEIHVDDEVVPCEDGAWTYDVIPHEETGEDAPAIIFATEQIPPPDSKVSVRYNRGEGDPADFCTGGAE